MFLLRERRVDFNEGGFSKDFVVCEWLVSMGIEKRVLENWGSLFGFVVRLKKGDGVFVVWFWVNSGFFIKVLRRVFGKNGWVGWRGELV